jgi:hypothetical protein
MNKILDGVILLRERFPEQCSGWAFNADSTPANRIFNQSTQTDIMRENLLATLTLASQIRLAESQRFEDAWKTIYTNDILGTFDNREGTKTRKEVISDLDDDLVIHMSNIYGIFNTPQRGFTGLDTDAGYAI